MNIKEFAHACKRRGICTVGAAREYCRLHKIDEPGEEDFERAASYDANVKSQTGYVYHLGGNKTERDMRALSCKKYVQYDPSDEDLF